MANNERRNAADYVIAGGTLLGASAAADGAVAYDRKVRSMDGPIRAATKRKFTRRHAGQIGVKLGGRAAFAAGAPLAAYGGYKMVRPDGPVPKLDAKRDVVKPVTRGVTLKDLADEQERRFRKADNLTRKETNTLVARKKRGQHISTAAGVMGLGALALRAPEAAKFATKRSAKAGKNAALKRLVSREPSATKASNALGIVSIGTGAAGSLNYAAQQKLEAKQIKKGLYDGVVRGIGRVRVVERTKPGYVTVYDAKDTKRFMPESRVTPVPKRGKKKAKLVPVDKPSPVQGQQLELFKADRFLNQYGDRISPKAEEGYKYLKRGRNRRIADAGVSAGFAGLSGGVGLHALKRGSKGWAAVGAAGAALSGVSAARSANDAARWDSKMGKIKAKAKERAAAGQYGNGRLVTKSARDKAEGVAQTAAGGAALGLGLSTNRIMNTAQGRWDKKVNGKYDRMLSSVPLGRDKAQKKERGKAVSVINQQRNQHLTQNPYKKIGGAKGGGRVALISAGFAAAAPNIWMGSRKMVEKADKHDVDAFMGGALATAGAYHGALYATKGPLDRRFEREWKKSPNVKNAVRQHAKKHGLDRNKPPVGDTRWLKYHRDFPKQATNGPVPYRPDFKEKIPGARWKRAASRLQGGKTQIAITGGLAAVGGLAAAKANRKFHPVEERKVKKSFGLARSAFMPRSTGIRAPRIRKPAIRRSYIARSASGKKFTVRGSLR
jgi:hypothetical protein